MFDFLSFDVVRVVSLQVLTVDDGRENRHCDTKNQFLKFSLKHEKGV